MFGARILVVEDDELLRDLVSRNLRARHHEVHIAADAHDALTSLRTMSFDLILLDINLPDLTGWEICGQLNEKSACTHSKLMTITPSSLSSCSLRCVSVHSGWPSFIPWHICPNLFRWMPYSAWQQKRPSGARRMRKDDY